MTLHLHGATRAESLAGVAAFEGEDASGRFALLPHAERAVTCLGFGLARVRFADGRVEHLALPGAVLHFVHPDLSLATRRWVRSPALADVVRALDEELRRERDALADLRLGVRRLDEELLRRLWRLRRGEPR